MPPEPWQRLGLRQDALFVLGGEAAPLGFGDDFRVRARRGGRRGATVLPAAALRVE